MAGNNYKLYDDDGGGVGGFGWGDIEEEICAIRSIVGNQGTGVGGFGWGDIEEEICAIRSIVGNKSNGGGWLRPVERRQHGAKRLPVISAGANRMEEISNSNGVGNQSGDNMNYRPVAQRVHGANQRPVTRSMASSAGDNGVRETGPDALRDISTPEQQDIKEGRIVSRRRPEGGFGPVAGRPHGANQWLVEGLLAISVGANEIGGTQTDYLKDHFKSDNGTLRLLEQQDSKEGIIVPMKQPADRLVQLQANCFPVKLSSEKTLFQYDFHIEFDETAEIWLGKRPLKKSDCCLLWEKLLSDNPSRFTRDVAVFDGVRIFSSDKLPTEQFKLELHDASYIVALQLVNEYKYSVLNDYLNGVLENNPHDILQGFDVIMKESLSKNGVKDFTGIQQSLKFTSNTLALFLDTSVLPFCKPMPVIDFLKENVRDFHEAKDVNRLRRDVELALKGLKVNVSHHTSNNRFKVKGLTKEMTGALCLTWGDRHGKHTPRNNTIVDYFVRKYQKNIVHTDIPCLQLGKKRAAVPLEFCVIADGQRYKGKLDNGPRKIVTDIHVVPPAVRKNMICETVRSGYGPSGVQVCQNFGLEVDTNMTRVSARVLEPPTVKLGNGTTAEVDRDKLKWNFFTKSLVKGVQIQRWALIDFSNGMLNKKTFIDQLMKRCTSLGVLMEEPLATTSTNIDQFQSVEDVCEQLRQVIHRVQASCKIQGELQLIVCALNQKRPRYDLIKLVSEVKIGVLTQCFFTKNANSDKNDRFLANLALKINAKLGGSNFELDELSPGLKEEDHVMLIGAEVNHPASLNATSQSIASVVATINWPSLNRYAARICLQEPKREQIVEFGSMCLDLLNTYARLNGVKPRRIVVFRDGVIDGQFDTVFNEEFSSLKAAIYEEDYKPEITLIVAQKKHTTRLFLEKDWENVPLGTVVDSKITHPSQFNFYLCSHFDSLGSSKSTHYQALWGKDHFTADELQKLVYDLCFTFARCTEPVWLVPPVYYAHLAARRARLHHDTAMKMQSSGFTSPSSWSSKSFSSASSIVDFDKNLVKVHPNLQDSMYFI